MPPENVFYDHLMQIGNISVSKKKTVRRKWSKWCVVGFNLISVRPRWCIFILQLWKTTRAVHIHTCKVQVNWNKLSIKFEIMDGQNFVFLFSHTCEN